MNNGFLNILPEADLIESLSRLGVTTPTAVQAAAIPVAISGKDLIVEAQTGSGKTLAFSLPLIAQVRKQKNKVFTYAIIITPTRELATQVKNVIHSVTNELNCPCLIGGDNINRQISEIKKDARLLIGTPGRILDLLERKEISLNKCQAFVLDEADEMLSMGFIDDIKSICSKLPKQRQGLLFSATISNGVKSLAYQFLKDAVEINIEKTKELTPKISHRFIRLDGAVGTKLHTTCQILQTHKVGSAIVFCNTKSDTELVEVFLKRRGFDAMKINSDLSQKDRDKVLTLLREKKLKFLIATDIAARGIDIKELDMVINFSLHNEVETYVHRSGRTGRAGAEGIAISLIGPQDHGSFYTLQKQLKLDFSEMNLSTSLAG